jgi:hypothetical protein
VVFSFSDIDLTSSCSKSVRVEKGQYELVNEARSSPERPLQRSRSCLVRPTCPQQLLTTCCRVPKRKCLRQNRPGGRIRASISPSPSARLPETIQDTILLSVDLRGPGETRRQLPAILLKGPFHQLPGRITSSGFCGRDFPVWISLGAGTAPRNISVQAFHTTLSSA